MARNRRKQRTPKNLRGSMSDKNETNRSSGSGRTVSSSSTPYPSPFPSAPKGTKKTPTSGCSGKEREASPKHGLAGGETSREGGEKMEKQTDCDINVNGDQSRATPTPTSSTSIRGQGQSNSATERKKRERRPVDGITHDDGSNEGRKEKAREGEDHERQEKGKGKGKGKDHEKEKEKVKERAKEEQSEDNFPMEEDSEESGETGQNRASLASSGLDDDDDTNDRKLQSRPEDKGRGADSSPRSPVHSDGTGTCKTPDANSSSSINNSCKTGRACDDGNSNNSIGKKRFKDDKTGEWTCPVCETRLDSQHSFTVHIRQHNPTDHSHTCSICGKTLSSASSLDRHMLIHSGERPFKCRICNMAFTTNGNMHRHMRTHGMETNDLEGAPDGNNNRLSKAKKRKASSGLTDPSADSISPSGAFSPKARRHSEGDGDSSCSNGSGYREELECQVCDKRFANKSALDSHLETHPNESSTCRDCGVTLPLPNMAAHRCIGSLFNGGHKFGLTPPPPPPPMGFFDLNFTDFSSNKFSLIAKSFCEHNLRKSSSPYHDFECGKCQRAFPCNTALNLHQTSHSDTFCELCNCDLVSPAMFFNHQLKHQLEGSLSSHFSGLPMAPDFLSRNHSILNELHKNSAAFPHIPRGEKNGFMAMLQLHNKDTENNLFPDQDPDRSPSEDCFENPSYFIHAKPSPVTLIKTTTFQPRQINGGSDTDSGKPDLADIQSIISVTSSANPLRNIRSSPPAASPASPIESTGGANKPASPVPRDTHNGHSAALSEVNGDRDDLTEGEAEEEADRDADGDVGDSETCLKSEEEDREPEAAEKADKGDQRDALTEEGNQSEEMFKCSTCSLSFKSSNALKRHNRSHSQGGHSYACTQCPYTSLDKSTLVRHLRTHNGERPFQCAICKYAFTTKANCERHVRKRHKKTNKLEIRGSMQYNSNMSTSSTSNLTIQNVSKHDSSSATLSPVSGPEFPGNNDTVCKYCNVDFKYNRLLRHHLRSLHNSCSRKPYSCTICKLGFSTKNNCVRHVMKQHPEIRDRLGSVVINGSSIASNSGSDFSESESYLNDSPSLQYSLQDSQGMNPSAPSSLPDDRLTPDGLSHQHHSLAALCQVAGEVSAGVAEPLNLASRNEGYEGGDESEDEQPFDLSRGAYNGRGGEPHDGSDQPLDLAVHALDLSVKSKRHLDAPQSAARNVYQNGAVNLSTNSTTSSANNKSHNNITNSVNINCTQDPDEEEDDGKEPQNERPFDMRKSEAARNAATTLLALHSVVPGHNAFIPPPTGLFRPSLQLPGSVPQSHSSSLFSAEGGPKLPNHNIMESIYKFSAFRLANKGPMLSKNQRSFTCPHCSAGFTLKSNMERHIKRKHPLFAKPPRSRGSSSKGTKESASLSTGTSPNSLSLLSKPNNATLSSKTRAALRVVLSNKAMGFSTSVPNNGSRPASPADSMTSNSDQAELQITDDGVETQDESADLASVSSLIDHSANSSNTLKKYFDTQETETEKNEVPVVEDLSQQVRPLDSLNTSRSSDEDREAEENEEADTWLGSEGEREGGCGAGVGPEEAEDVNVEASSCNKLTGDNVADIPKKRSAYTDSPNSVSCPYCSRKFPWSSSLRRHILTHTGLKPYKCPKCPILFTTKSNCERHLVRKHGCDQKRAISEASVVVPQDPAKHYKCNLCPSSYFSTQGNLRKHYYLRHWTKTGRGPSLLKNSRREESVADKSTSSEKLEMSSNSVDSEPERDAEREGSHSGATFKCHLCENETFDRRMKCLQHLESFHSHEYQVLLNKGAVDKIPTSETKLILTRAKDTDAETQNKVYCVFCPRQFVSDDNLRRHMSFHLGLRPFRCHLCPRRFSLKNSLLRHYRTNHPDAAVPARAKTKRRLTLMKINNGRKAEGGPSNSLLYLMPKVNDSMEQPPAPSSIGTTGTGVVSDSRQETEQEEDTSDGGDLIQNLLGIQDSKMLDQILDSADSAARLLGVNYALEGDKNGD